MPGIRYLQKLCREVQTAEDDSLFHYLSALLCMGHKEPGVSISNQALEKLERAEGHSFHLAHIIMAKPIWSAAARSMPWKITMLR